MVSKLLGFAGSLALLGVSFTVNSPAQKAKPATGEQLFANRCAPCHGKKAEGGAGFSGPLKGNLAVAELSKYIHLSMPPSGKKLTLAEAQRVGDFVFNAFYSPLAQERNRPARVQLSRLTVKQFRNAVADIVGQSRSPISWSEKNGLKARYYKSRNFDEKQKGLERLDPEVNFDFGIQAPQQEGFDPTTFAIRWEGSIIAPETGDYEFCIESDHAVRLWLNGWKAPVVDAWVKSGKETEFKNSVYLIGGRSYPALLEFSKAKQGVDDTKKTKSLPPLPASVRLKWRRPHLAMELIPTRFLMPNGSAQSLVVSTPFPADDRSIGYERGTTVSKAWDESTTAAAIEVSSRITENLETYTGIQPEAKDKKERVLTYAKRFVESAFRRPLTAEVEKAYVTKHLEAAASPELGLKRVILLALKSPRFLYREISPEDRDAYSIASDLSFGLWDALPDQELLNAAKSGDLKKPEVVAAQAQRMLKDTRAWTKLRDFLLLWVKVDEVQDLVKNAKNFPDFDPVVATDLRSSLELYLKDTAWSEASDYRELMTSKAQFMNGRLAKLYGANLPPEAGFTKVEFEPEKRAGVLTHPYLLARFAYLDGSSPIHRGVMIARNMLGRALQPPPAAFAPLAASLHPSFTTRERVAFQTKPANCNTCHSMINPLGFTLERFDAIGRIRTKDNGKAVDATGFYKSRTGKTVNFKDAVDLANYIASSDEAHSAFVEKLFHHLVKQPVLAYGPNTLGELKQKFVENQYSIRKLMAEIMTKTVLSRSKETANGTSSLP